MKNVTVNFIFRIYLFVIAIVGLTNCSQYSEPQGLINRPVEQKATPLQQIEEPYEATFSSIKLNIINKKCLACHKPDSANKKAADIPLTKETDVLTGSSSLGDLVVPGSPEKSIFYRVMTSNEKVRGKAHIMPPPNKGYEAVTAEELQIVSAWISGVAKKDEQKTPVLPIDPKECVKTPEPTPVAANPPVVANPPQTPAPGVVEPAVLNYSFIKTQILETKCMGCHKAGGDADEIIFSDLQSMLKLTNEDNYPLVVAGKPEQSLLYISVVKDDSIRQDIRLMPPKKAVLAGKVKDITEQEVNWIKKWITEGAK